MAKSPTEIFNEKVSLIFEYDKSSPLFVRQANTEIENNNAERAIEILNEGIKLYPDYPTAYIVFSKALSLTGEYGKALQQVKIASNLLHSPQTYEYYLKEIEGIRKRSSLFASSRGNAFIPEFNQFEKEEIQPDLFDEELVLNLMGKDEQANNVVDKESGKLVDETSIAKISESQDESSDDKPNQEYESGFIISETLAKIYASQGEYKEAIKVYEKLIQKTPSKKEDYIQKIKELNSRFKS